MIGDWLVVKVVGWLGQGVDVGCLLFREDVAHEGEARETEGERGLGLADQGQEDCVGQHVAGCEASG